jgi:sulfoxide reductase heme-binding subunit YedZ
MSLKKLSMERAYADKTRHPNPGFGNTRPSGDHVFNSRTSMWKSPWLPRLVFVACLAPFLVLAWKWTHNDLGINRLEYVARYTGATTIRLLLITLAITPLRRIPSLSPLIRFRRMLGLFTFSYGLLHAYHYFAIDAQWNTQILYEDFTMRRFFIAGAIALTLMIPLALTSFDRAIRWMGGKNWQRLHRLIYISAIAGVTHYWWQGKVATRTPILYAAILTLLLGIRVVFYLEKRVRRKRRALTRQGIA